MLLWKIGSKRGIALKDYLSMHYYYNDDGTADEIVDSLGDCIVQSAYVILKNKYNFRNDYYKAFLNEITVKLSLYNDNSIACFETIENNFNKNLFSLKEYEENENTVNKVSEILNSGEIPIIKTIVERLPYSSFFDETYKLNQIRTHHVFLIVGEDTDNFFYIDNPSVISFGRFNAFSGNKEVGVLPKNILYNVTKDISSIFVVDFNFNTIDKYINDPLYAFLNSKNNYILKSEIEDGETYFFGRQALLKLKELLEMECINLESVAPSYDRSMVKYLNWKIWNIKGRRKLLWYYLKENNSNVDETGTKLINALDNSVTNWLLLYRVLYRDYLKGNLILGNQYINLLKNIIACEDEIYGILSS